jgi:hypothetical protein
LNIVLKILTGEIVPVPIDPHSGCSVPSVPIPEWAQFIAQDADGTWWAYEAEPNQQDTGWYENEVGRIRRLGKTEPPTDFREMLIKLTETFNKPADSHLNK